MSGSEPATRSISTDESEIRQAPFGVVALIRAVVFDRAATVNMAVLIGVVALALSVLVFTVGVAAGYAGVGAAIASLIAAATGGSVALSRLRRR